MDTWVGFTREGFSGKSRTLRHFHGQVISSGHSTSLPFLHPVFAGRMDPDVEGGVGKETFEGPGEGEEVRPGAAGMGLS